MGRAHQRPPQPGGHRRPLGQVCRGSRQQLPEHLFNGIWIRQTDYFTAPSGVITLTGYGTAEGTQKYKIALWRKVDGGAQYVDGSTYYIKTDGQNYRCSIGGLDPAASYRLTISYDSSRYYLYGGLKVEGIAG